ncbi:hypothetical protein EHM76_05330 [bacterium]|nr:MAG: hypothetical protein EHM76_05330 [bacterium]
MLTFISIAGFLLAVVVFLNVLQSGSPRSVTATAGNSHRPRPGVKAGTAVAKVLREMKPDTDRPRICPVCGTMLSQEHFLFAAMEPEPTTNRKRQVQIYGCPFCYSSDGVNLQKNNIEMLDPM